jgi:hypothetical protein
MHANHIAEPVARANAHHWSFFSRHLPARSHVLSSGERGSSVTFGGNEMIDDFLALECTCHPLGDMYGEETLSMRKSVPRKPLDIERSKISLSEIFQDDPKRISFLTLAALPVRFQKLPNQSPEPRP